MGEETPGIAAVLPVVDGDAVVHPGLRHQWTVAGHVVDQHRGPVGIPDEAALVAVEVPPVFAGLEHEEALGPLPVPVAVPQHGPGLAAQARVGDLDFDIVVEQIAVDETQGLGPDCTTVRSGIAPVHDVGAAGAPGAHAAQAEVAIDGAVDLCRQGQEGRLGETVRSG